MPYFFFSYARQDWGTGRQAYLKRFFDDLCDLVAVRRKLNREKVGFLDRSRVRLGEKWTLALASALGNCRTFVYIRSPWYFDRRVCGIEWKVFNDRVRCLARRSKECDPLLMIPVLWTPPDDIDNLPAVARKIQYSIESNFGEQYSNKGLLYLLMNLEKHRAAYKTFLWDFAEVLLHAGKAWPLDPAPPVHRLTGSRVLSIDSRCRRELSTA